MRDHVKTLFEQWDELPARAMAEAVPDYRTLPGYGACTDPETLRAAAEIELAAERRIAAERGI